MVLLASLRESGKIPAGIFSSFLESVPTAVNFVAGVTVLAGASVLIGGQCSHRRLDRRSAWP